MLSYYGAESEARERGSSERRLSLALDFDSGSNRLANLIAKSIAWLDCLEHAAHR